MSIVKSIVPERHWGRLVQDCSHFSCTSRLGSRIMSNVYMCLFSLISPISFSGFWMGHPRPVPKDTVRQLSRAVEKRSREAPVGIPRSKLSLKSINTITFGFASEHTAAFDFHCGEIIKFHITEDVIVFAYKILSFKVENHAVVVLTLRKVSGTRVVIGLSLKASKALLFLVCSVSSNVHTWTSDLWLDSEPLECLGKPIAKRIVDCYPPRATLKWYRYLVPEGIQDLKSLVKPYKRQTNDIVLNAISGSKVDSSQKNKKGSMLKIRYNLIPVFS
ncbi:hypothetical protein FNV43_RR21554 [Rhamnella rubrinervis]|uniref:Uncharacterized protein n=1 Tax=Rhamnella rubrinervis TaxID=2594499 RepID=A0A8K0GUH0_9ROSA|nr:hypothetical protein FNV43_RR21554 [Rhamnella rubrinervis]